MEKWNGIGGQALEGPVITRCAAAARGFLARVGGDFFRAFSVLVFTALTAALASLRACFDAFLACLNALRKCLNATFAF